MKTKSIRVGGQGSSAQALAKQAQDSQFKAFLNWTPVTQENCQQIQPMGFHQAKKLLNIRGYSYQNEEKIHRMGKILPVTHCVKN
jgi:hypothetical protein